MTSNQMSDKMDIKQKYENESQQVATIVEENIENGNYSEISRKLEELPSSGFHKSEHAFNIQGKRFYSIMLFISVCVMASFLYFLIMGIGMLIYSSKYRVYGIIFLVSSLVVLIINALILKYSVSSIKFSDRYNKYYELLKYKNIIIIDDISVYSNIPYDTVVQDLALAIEKRLIPQGHLSTENLALLVSDDLYEIYSENQMIYDRYFKNIVEERIRIEERSEETQKILDIGETYISKIHGYNQTIKEKDISKKINQIEKIVKTIFKEVDLNPDKARILGMFLNYYLPTTDKLLDTYSSLIAKSAKGRPVNKMKEDIEHALDMLIISFEGILNQFYEELEMDVASEVLTLENITKKG